jgi:exodeoxyribonuclease VII large subunit
MTENPITLYDLNHNLKEALNVSFAGNYWVIAEISEMSVNSSGHCYLELIEKTQDSENIIAKARATIWSYTFRMLKPYFETTTGHSFTAGLKILFSASVEFHELYGLSLNIKDIEPSYTIGDLSRKRSEIIRKLQNEGIMNMNRELPLPIVPQKIAIISSPTAAGYGDFLDHIAKNNFGFKFYCKLFPATMQGNGAEDSVISAFEKIFEHESFFDLVVIIRGGGSQSDLSCFDSYEIASNIAQFPLPVISGIGHERDETIADMVSHTRMKTPTAVADFIITKVAEFEEYMGGLKDSFVERVNDLLAERRSYLESVGNKLKPITSSVVLNRYNDLNLIKFKFTTALKSYQHAHYMQLNAQVGIFKESTNKFLLLRKQELINKTVNLPVKINFFVSEKKHKLEILHKTNEFLDPVNVLKRGYSITFYNGKLLKDSSDVNNNEMIETRLFKGKINSRVENKEE